jgi:hypothetical protein
MRHHIEKPAFGGFIAAADVRGVKKKAAQPSPYDDSIRDITENSLLDSSL